MFLGLGEKYLNSSLRFGQAASNAASPGHCMLVLYFSFFMIKLTADHLPGPLPMDMESYLTGKLLVLDSQTRLFSSQVVAQFWLHHMFGPMTHEIYFIDYINEQMYNLSL